MLHRRYAKRLLDALRNSVEGCASDGIHKLDHLHARVRGRRQFTRRRVAVRGQSNNTNRARMECGEQAQGGHSPAAAETQVGGVNRIVKGRHKKAPQDVQKDKDAKRGKHFVKET